MNPILRAFGRFFFACSLLLPISAHAVGLEFGIGMAQSQDHGNGTWYQNGFPQSMSLTSPSLMLGLTGDATPNLRWHIDGIYLGHFSSSTLDTPNDANYSGQPPTYCNGPCLPLVRYSTSGDAFAFAPTLELHSTGAWQWGVIAGPMVYYQRFSVSVPDWYPSTQTAPGVFSVGPVTPISTSNHDWWVGGEVGISLRHGQYGLTLTEYIDNHGFPGHGADPWPALWKRQTILMFTRQF